MDAQATAAWAAALTEPTSCMSAFSLASCKLIRTLQAPIQADMQNWQGDGILWMDHTMHFAFLRISSPSRSCGQNLPPLSRAAVKQGGHTLACQLVTKDVS